MNQKWVAFLRIVVGVFFVAQGLNKLDWYATSEFLRTSLDRYSQNPPAVTSWYLTHVAYPGVEAWTRMIPTGEMLIGVALLLGILTRPTLLIAFLLVVNFHLTNGALFSTAFFTNPYAFLLLSCLVALFFSNSGAIFAVDAASRKKKSRGKG